MGKPNLSNLVKSVQTLVYRRSPEILIGLGVAGMITTTLLSVRATPKALRLIEEAEREKGEDLTTKEKVKACWKCYIPAVITGATSVACVIGASSIHEKRNTALAAAYKLAESSLSEYKEKVIETIGEKKEKLVRESIDQDRIEKNPVSKSEVIITEKGNTLCFESLSGRYFKSDIDKIKSAVNELNNRMLSETYISLSELYDYLDLDHTAISDQLGWDISHGLIEVSFSSHIADDGTPCIVLNFESAPEYGYYNFS